MLIRFLLIICFFAVNSSYAIVSSYQTEIDYDKMVQESSKRKHYTPEEIEAMQVARRNRRNAVIAQKMDNISRPKLSRPVSVGYQKISKSEKKEVDSIEKRSLLALIVLIFGVFMLLYSYSLFSSKKVNKT